MRYFNHLKRLPISLKVALLSTLVIFALNVAWALSQTAWKLDPGTATLAGAVIGLAIIGQQTRRGFINLVKSQNNQAELDRAARLHAAELEEQAAAKTIKADRINLLAALRSEIVGLLAAAHTATNTSARFAEIADALAKNNMPATTKTITYPTFDAPIYLANLTRIGLIGPSLGGDVVKVLSRTRNKKSDLTSDGVIPHSGVKMLYEASAESFKNWADDLLHVAMRIRSVEEGWPDPGTLAETHDARRAGTFAYTQAPGYAEALAKEADGHP
ncbi:hypothetical protein XI06_27285 [Bradyrhizobium sp. CCBAU 11434]|uniref:hypothetical protein n=1 Tax=Bradyrhizobium sp. CCBAU 11434 TaxID=1630885 RepID=UPI0023058F84|nr:hypothetical protein [Bradyrhizobium sp. CCBAU 11434]MDA9523881.1 hypothetical protein [Bradyrhizobium sp. CCBAU 11434]